MHRGHAEYLELAKKTADLLIVGVNADSSVRQNKGESRPLCAEQDRAFLVAALACVDYVFIFAEKNNNENVSLLRPEVYAKAGDYTKEKLTSAALVESYGGRVEFIPFTKGYSTTSLIDRISKLGSPSENPGLGFDFVPSPPLERRPAVFLDRDGTINEHVEYLGDPEKFQLIPGVIEAIKGFNGLGYRVVLVTNQPGIGMGYFSLEDFYRVMRRFLGPLGKAGGKVNKIYFCPHSAAEDCECRKPKTLLFERAAKELNLDLTCSFMIGDTSIDIEAGKRAGLRTILVATGIAGADKTYAVKPDYEAADLHAAYELIRAHIPAPQS